MVVCFMRNCQNVSGIQILLALFDAMVGEEGNVGGGGGGRGGGGGITQRHQSAQDQQSPSVLLHVFFFFFFILCTPLYFSAAFSLTFWPSDVTTLEWLQTFK